MIRSYFPLVTQVVMIFQILWKGVSIFPRSLRFTLTKSNNELFDRYLVLPFLALTCLSLVFIYSSSNVMANEIYSDPYFFFKRQLFAISIALIASVIFLFIPTSFYRENGAILVVISILLLFVVALPFIGTEVNGSRRWPSSTSIYLRPNKRQCHNK